MSCVPGKSRWEVHDVPEVGAAEGVDALAVVADRHDVVVRGREAAHDLRLQAVRVLVLVHHDVAVRAREAFGGLRGVAQQVAQQHQEIVVVDQAPLALVARVLLAEADDVVEVVEQVRPARRRRVRHGRAAVHRHAEDLEDVFFRGNRRSLRSSPARLRRSAITSSASPRSRIVNPGSRPIGAPRPAQHGVGEGVERPARDAIAAPADQRRGAAAASPPPPCG